MMEFITNCYNWILENRDSITTFVTSANFFSVVGMIVASVKTSRKTTDNVVASRELKSGLEANKETAELVKAIREQNVQIKRELDMERQENRRLQSEVLEVMDTIDLRLKSIVEVQSIVYSTIKDDTIRNTVNSILVNAKYAEGATRAKLAKEVEDLKAAVNDKIKDIESTVDKSVDVVKNTVNPEISKKEDVVDVMRY